MYSLALFLPGLGSWFWLISLIAIVRLLCFRYHHSLHKYNGPYLASYTNLWRLYNAYRNRYEEPLVKIHEKYGPIVRLGPNVLSFGQPQAIRDIYGPGKNFIKVSAMFYREIFQGVPHVDALSLLIVRILSCRSRHQQRRNGP